MQPAGKTISAPGVATVRQVVSPNRSHRNGGLPRSPNGKSISRSTNGAGRERERERDERIAVRSPADTVTVAKSAASEFAGVCMEMADGDEDASPNAALDPSNAVDPALLYCNLWLFIWLKVIGSYDSGAFASAIGAADGMSDTWGLSFMQQGTLSSSVFLGNVIGCPLAGQLFSSHSEKYVLSVSLCVHTFFTFTFATFPSYYLALVNRFFIGLSLAFIVVYTPVWVDEFAPKDRQSIWMASHNAGVPLGIMFGYLAAAFLPTHLNISWEWAFYLKCVLMIPTISYVLKVDSRSINTARRRPAGGERLAGSDLVPPTTAAAITGSGTDAAAVGPRTIMARVRSHLCGLMVVAKPLLGNRVYMCAVLSMSSLYFVATGLQNYVTRYLTEPPFLASMNTLMLGFGTSVVSAPVCGVIVGGILLDKLGGYQGNLLTVALFALTWGIVAAIFAVICIAVQSTTAFLLVMSVVLFCGGAIIPPGVGLTMTALPDHLRSFGAAFSQFMYNTLGNFSGPLVCGFVAQLTGELRYGIMTLLLSSSLGLIPMSIILVLALRQRGGGGSTGAGGGDGGRRSGGGASVVVIIGDDSRSEGQEMPERGGASGDRGGGGATMGGAGLLRGGDDDDDTSGGASTHDEARRMLQTLTGTAACTARGGVTPTAEEERMEVESIPSRWRDRCSHADTSSEQLRGCSPMSGKSPPETIGSTAASVDCERSLQTETAAIPGTDSSPSVPWDGDGDGDQGPSMTESEQSSSVAPVGRARLMCKDVSLHRDPRSGISRGRAHSKGYEEHGRDGQPSVAPSAHGVGLSQRGDGLDMRRRAVECSTPHSTGAAVLPHVVPLPAHATGLGGAADHVSGRRPIASPQEGCAGDRAGARPASLAQREGFVRSEAKDSPDTWVENTASAGPAAVCADHSQSPRALLDESHGKAEVRAASGGMISDVQVVDTDLVLTWVHHQVPLAEGRSDVRQAATERASASSPR